MNSTLVYRGTTCHDYNQVSPWCIENCGEFDVGWYRMGRDPMDAILSELPVVDIYYFATEEMLALFLLRWA